MKKSYLSAALVSIAAWLLVGTAAANRRPVILLEGSIESTADQIGLPSYDQGIVTVRACAACAARTLYFKDQPNLFVSGRPVTVAQLKAALAAAGDTPVTVHYRLSDFAITRIVLVK